MKIVRTKIIFFDLDTEIAKVKSLGYTPSEKKHLLRLYELVRQGEFEKAVKFTQTWGRTKDEHPETEHIPEVIWDIIFEINMGTSPKQFTVEK